MKIASPLKPVMLAIAISLFIGVETVVAMCIPFLPPGRTFEPAKNIKTLVVFDGKEQTMVVQPQFSGNAKQFGLVMVAPSKPAVSEAPEDIFSELEDLTNPVHEFPAVLEDCINCAQDESKQGGVDVIEEREVGDYKSAVLKADSDKDLLRWLINNDYTVSDENRSVIDRYVSDGSYFIALKVNFSKAEVDSAGNLKGELSPIAFTYESSKIQLPTRLMAPVDEDAESDETEEDTEDTSAFFSIDPDAPVREIRPALEHFNMTVYVLAPEPYYVPGASIQFSKILTLSDVTEAPSLTNYNGWKRWLVRSQFELDVDQVQNDLVLERGVSEMIVEPGDTALKVNPHLIQAGSGVIESEIATTKYFNEPDSPTEYSKGIPLRTLSLLAVVVLLGVAIAWVTYRKQRGLKALPEVPKNLKSQLTPSKSFGAAVFGLSQAVLLSGGALFLIYLSDLLPAAASGSPLVLLVQILFAVVLLFFFAAFGIVLHIRTIIKYGWRAFFISLGVELVSLLVILIGLVKILGT